MAYYSFDGLVDLLQVQAANLPTYQGTLGVSNTMLTQLTDDLADLEYIGDYAEIVDANKKAVFSLKAAVFNGDPDVPAPAFPVFPVAGPPNTPPQTGILERTQARNRFFKAAPGYTEEIGVALGIAGGGSSPINPGSVTPTIEVFAAASGAMFSCVVGNRVESDSWIVQILRSGGVSGGWQNAGTFTGKSADVTITLTNPSQPEQIQVRVQLRKANANYGNVSPAFTITVNP